MYDNYTNAGCTKWINKRRQAMSSRHNDYAAVHQCDGWTKMAIEPKVALGDSNGSDLEIRLSCPAPARRSFCEVLHLGLRLDQFKHGMGRWVFFESHDAGPDRLGIGSANDGVDQAVELVIKLLVGQRVLVVAGGGRRPPRPAWSHRST